MTDISRAKNKPSKKEKPMHPILLLSLTAIAAKLAQASVNVGNGEAFKLSGPNAKTKALLKWMHEVKGIVIKPFQFVSLSLLSGISCPGANVCKSQAVVDPRTGKRTILDSPNCKFRCFAANDEATYTETYEQRKHNRDLVYKYKNDPYKIAALLMSSLRKEIKLVRFHIGGDFFCFNYLLAVILVAKMRPDLKIYFYTKSLHFVHKLNCNATDLPSNMSPVLSEEGLFDSLLPELKSRGFRSVKVVLHPAEAEDLEIDHKDNLAAFGTRDFALLIHGSQPKGSEAGKAVHSLKKEGIKVGYKRKGSKGNAETARV